MRPENEGILFKGGPAKHEMPSPSGGHRLPGGEFARSLQPAC